jgi:hypothetical protein
MSFTIHLYTEYQQINAERRTWHSKVESLEFYMCLDISESLLHVSRRKYLGKAWDVRGVKQGLGCTDWQNRRIHNGSSAEGRAYWFLIKPLFYSSLLLNLVIVL